MSGSTDENGHDPAMPSIFDERPGVGLDDQPQDPDAVDPAAVAPDLHGDVLGDNGIISDRDLP